MIGRPAILVLGYGNTGRGDDGLGPAAAEAVRAQGIDGVDVRIREQLQIEDALALADRDDVVFVDADATGPAPFTFRRLEPQRGLEFSTHSVAPAALLALARDLFGATGRGHLLGIRGYEFETFHDVLSAPARANLQASLAFALPWLRASSRRGGAGPDEE